VPSSSLAPWRFLSTLKFKIVALAVASGVLSAAVTAVLLIRSTQQSIQRVVLAAAADDRERAAAMLSNKVSVLRDSLAATARHIPPEAWNDAALMGRYLLDKPALGTMFAALDAVAPDGQVFSRAEGGRLSAELPKLADRAYFRQALASDQPVISEVVLSRVLKVPVVVFAAAAPGSDGRPAGVLAGSLAVSATSLFSEVRDSARGGGALDLIIDREGHVIAHPDPSRVMQAADAEPGLHAVVRNWLDSGSPIDTVGAATVEGDHVVARTGIPLTDWVSIRVTPAAIAFAPVADARATALPAAALAGLAAGMLAGVLAYGMTRPISRLQARAVSLLDAGAGVAAWPADVGEVGELANVFRHVVEQRERRQTEVQALLQQIEAVLDHAEVGIALTRNGRFELVSHQFCLMFRCEKAEVIGQATRLIYPSEDAFAALARRAQPAFVEQGAFDTELELIRRSGQVFWARMRGRAVVAGDVSKGTIWTIEDVTAAREQRERLLYSSTHDALTGLANRAAFEALLDSAAATAEAEPFWSTTAAATRPAMRCCATSPSCSRGWSAAPMSWPGWAATSSPCCCPPAHASRRWSLPTSCAAPSTATSCSGAGRSIRWAPVLAWWPSTAPAAAPPTCFAQRTRPATRPSAAAATGWRFSSPPRASCSPRAEGAGSG
jgi:diguanylate cyclase